ncbi:MAG: BolA family transcriptional regulator [Candidatus Omnitrophica bacterium]|nr:BolA family transcriptional regulator [Candidatus Omnitrophota bacterium]
MLTKARIEEILKEAFRPTRLVVTDDSHKHAGHNPQAAFGGTHYSVEIISSEFTGRKLVDRHRMIYAVLAEGLQTHVHALAIKALAPDEAA